MKHVLVIAAVMALGGAAAADPAYKCKAVDPSTKISATFASTVSLMDLTAWVVGFSCKNVVFTPEVAKNATRLVIAAPTDMTPKQALKLFVDALDAGLTVTDKGDTLVIKPAKGMPACPDLAAAPPPAPVVAQQPPAEQLSDAELDAGVKSTDATHVTVAKTLVDKILANPMAVAQGARVVPAVSNGKPAGFKLYAIRPSSLFARLGLQNGDTLTAINGNAIDSADKALEVYTKIRDASTLQLDLTRKGSTVQIVIEVVMRRLVLIAIACGGLARPPDPSRHIDLVPAGKAFRSDRGYTFAIFPEPGASVMRVDIRYPVGTANDPPGKEGLAHLVEHLRFALDGAALGRVALAWSGQTSADYTDYEVVAPPAAIGDVLAIEASRAAAGCAGLTQEVSPSCARARACRCAARCSTRSIPTAIRTGAPTRSTPSPSSRSTTRARSSRARRPRAT